MNHTSPYSQTPRNILVCQQRQIGDVLLTTPLLELLKRRWPQARVTLFTEAKCIPLLEGNPHVDAFLALDKSRLHGLPAQLAWCRRAAARGFDLVVDCQQLPRCRMLTLFCALSGTETRLSFPSAWTKLGLYNLAAAQKTDLYAAATKASLLAPLGIAWQGEKPRIYLADEERKEASALLGSLGVSGNMRLITVDPTHRRASKRWPAERWARVLDLLAEDDASLRFLLLRGPSSRTLFRPPPYGCGAGCSEYCRSRRVRPGMELSLPGACGIPPRTELLPLRAGRLRRSAMPAACHAGRSGGKGTEHAGQPEHSILKMFTETGEACFTAPHIRRCVIPLRCVI